MAKRAIQALVLSVLIAAPAALIAAGAPEELRLEDQLASMEKVGVGPVVYTHAKHEKRNKCADCHPKIFKEKRGATGINMKGNMEGKFCGSPNCHNSEKAFPLYECTKCHTAVKGAKGGK